MKKIQNDNWIIKIKNLPVKICVRNKEHKFIQTRKRQASCLFCLWHRPYPPPTPVNLYADDYDIPDDLDNYQDRFIGL